MASTKQLTEYTITIIRSETFGIKARCAEEAVDLAFECSVVDTDSVPCEHVQVLSHRCETDSHTVDEVRHAKSKRFMRTQTISRRPASSDSPGLAR